MVLAERATAVSRAAGRDLDSRTTACGCAEDDPPRGLKCSPATTRCYSRGEAIKWGGGEVTPFLANVPVVVKRVGIIPGQYVFADPSGAVVFPVDHSRRCSRERAPSRQGRAAYRENIKREEHPKRRWSVGAGKVRGAAVSPLANFALQGYATPVATSRATLVMWFSLRQPELAEEFERLMASDRDIVHSSLDTMPDWRLMRPTDVPGQAD